MITYTVDFLLKFQNLCIKPPKDLIIPDYGNGQKWTTQSSNFKHPSTHKRPAIHKKPVIHKRPPTFSKKDLHSQVLLLLNKLGKANLESTANKLTALIDKQNDKLLFVLQCIYEKLLNDDEKLVHNYVQLVKQMHVVLAFIDLVSIPPNDVSKSNSYVECILLLNDIQKFENPLLKSNRVDILMEAMLTNPESQRIFDLYKKCAKNADFSNKFFEKLKNPPWKDFIQVEHDLFSVKHYNEVNRKNKCKNYSKLLLIFYEKNVLSINNLHWTIDNGLKDPNVDDGLLHAIFILDKVGSQLQIQRTAVTMDIIKKLFADKSINSKIRFGLMDVWDAYNRNWNTKK